jgi:predicted membrane protein
MSERNYFREVIVIFIIILVIQAVLFSFFHKIGIFFVLGLFIYFLFFIYRDRKMKKEELEDLLHHEKSWKGYDRIISKEIP